MSDKMTTMVLKVDLHCSSCSKKIKKVLCKFRQIRNQVYDEKANTVTITVVCCNPEKMRDKLCCKGGKTIKSIQIIEKTKETEKIKVVEKIKEKEKQKVEEKTEESGNGKETEKTKVVEKIKEKEKQKVEEKTEESGKGKQVPPDRVCCGQCSEGHYGGPCYQGYGRVRLCCGQCSEGHYGGPCYQGYGRPVPCYDGYGYGYGYYKKKICYVSRCDYFNEENTSGCTIM